MSYTGPSIVEYLNKETNIDSSFENRKQIAEELGMKPYTGTAQQNTALLEYYRDDKPIPNHLITVGGGGAVTGHGSSAYASGTGGSASSYTGSSIVEYLNKETNIDSSFENRKQIAEELGMKPYTGTAQQNTALLEYYRDHKPIPGRLITDVGGRAVTGHGSSAYASGTGGSGPSSTGESEPSSTGPSNVGGRAVTGHGSSAYASGTGGSGPSSTGESEPQTPDYWRARLGSLYHETGREIDDNIIDNQVARIMDGNDSYNSQDAIFQQYVETYGPLDQTSSIPGSGSPAAEGGYQLLNNRADAEIERLRRLAETGKTIGELEVGKTIGSDNQPPIGNTQDRYAAGWDWVPVENAQEQPVADARDRAGGPLAGSDNQPPIGNAQDRYIADSIESEIDRARAIRAEFGLDPNDQESNRVWARRMADGMSEAEVRAGIKERLDERRQAVADARDRAGGPLAGSDNQPPIGNAQDRYAADTAASNRAQHAAQIAAPGLPRAGDGSSQMMVGNVNVTKPSTPDGKTSFMGPIA